jgi:hypothetical protein
MCVLAKQKKYCVLHEAGDSEHTCGVWCAAARQQQSGGEEEKSSLGTAGHFGLTDGQMGMGFFFFSKKESNV